MKNFRGFDDWIEIFRGGKQIDSQGREHDGDGLIEKAVNSFDAKTHEPPVVVGHPKDNAPAFGWITGLKKIGNVLQARVKDVVPEFQKAVEAGLYRKRSASFYPDGRLRHVGFLGAAPPAVKALADLKFEDDDGGIVFEFEEKSPQGVEYRSQLKEIPPNPPLKKGGEGGILKKEDKMKFKDFLEVFKFWKQVEKDPDLELPASGTMNNGLATGGAFTEADLERTKKEAAEAERKKVEAEFAEKTRQGAKQARGKEISDWVERQVKEGVILPSWAKSGLPEFMQAIDSETDIEFAEGEKKGPVKWFQDFLESFGKSPIFKEIATKLAAGDSPEFAEAKKDQEMGESIAAKVA